MFGYHIQLENGYYIKMKIIVKELGIMMIWLKMQKKKEVEINNKQKLD